MYTYEIADFGEQFAREPILRRMDDGSFLCLFLTGGPKEPHNDNVVAVSRSFDDGISWTKPETLFAHGARGVWATEMCTLFPRPMIALHTYCAENIYRELQSFHSESSDGGRTWSEPASYADGLNGVTLRQGIRLSNGEVLFPLYWEETVRRFDWTKPAASGEGEGEDWPFRCGAAITPDGKRFSRYGYIAAPKGLWEPNCAELERGHVMMLIRDNARPFLARSDSLDYGRTWSAPAPTDIPNPNTKLTLTVVGGKLLLISNFCETMAFTRRTHLAIRVYDAGFTRLEREIALEPEQANYFYPHAYADDSKGKLYVAYENAHRHKLAVLDYEELGL